jgi:hypothetical protein
MTEDWEHLAYTDHLGDYPPMPRNYTKCDKCGDDLTLAHHCQLLSEIAQLRANWNDLHDRLENAARVLTEMAQVKDVLGHDSDVDRLRGKVSGVGLALSYMREYPNDL